MTYFVNYRDLEICVHLGLKSPNVPLRTIYQSTVGQVGDSEQEWALPPMSCVIPKATRRREICKAMVLTKTDVTCKISTIQLFTSFADSAQYTLIMEAL